MLDKAKQLYNGLAAAADAKSLARILTIVENDLAGAFEILKLLKPKQTPVIGITGPPGAGKSTLVNALIELLLKEKKRIAVLAVDPTSPFNKGSLLGDRIRMKDQFNHPDVFIRSLATRGALGGLSAKTVEMVDVLRSAHFDYIFIETVGVGQSEIEIASLADLTVVLLVPESGDEIQHIKSGLMEIADVFVVNKADRPDAETFRNSLKKLVNYNHKTVNVLAIVANKYIGVERLIQEINQKTEINSKKRLNLLTEKAWLLIQNQRMQDINKEALQQQLAEAQSPDFNLYKFIEEFKCS